jgi:cellulose biosynthesis protein BcsQ
MTHVTAVGNHKGGPGKTATAVNLACALARRNRTVLLVDMDPQGNATRRIAAAFDPSKTPSVSEVIKADTPGAALAAMVPCRFEIEYATRIQVIGAAIDLTNRSNESYLPGAAARLANSLDGSLDGIDDVLIDNGPSLGLLTQMSLAAADDVLGVVQPEIDAMDGAASLVEFVALNGRKLGNPGLTMAGMVLSIVQNISIHRDRTEELRDLYGDLILDPEIPARVGLKEAAEAAVPLEQAGRQGMALVPLYDKLAGSLLARRRAA